MAWQRNWLTAPYLPALAAGAILQLLFPAALLDINGFAFRSGFLLHALLQGAAVLSALVVLIKLARRAGTAGVLCLTLFGLFLFLTLFLGLLPATARDAHLYHLAVPKWWLSEGKMHPIHWHEWSFFPLLISLGYAGFLQFGLERLTTYYNLSYLLIAAGVTGSFVKSVTKEDGTALLAALLLFSLPLNIGLSVQPMADHAVLMYFSIAFLAACMAVQTKLAWSWSIMAGLSLGLANCCKYSSFLATALFIPLLALYWTRECKGTPYFKSKLTIVIVLALGIVSPWLVRNYFWAGNPVFPFLQSTLGGGDFNVAFTSDISPLVYRLEVFGEKYWQLLALPLRIFFSGKDGDPSRFDGVLSPFLLLALLPLFYKNRPGWVNFFSGFWFSLLLFSLLLFYALLRYQLPGVFALTALSAFAVSALNKKQPLKTICVLALAAHFLFCGYYAGTLFVRQKAHHFLRERQTSAQYLSSRFDDYAMIDFVNRHIEKDAGVYLVFTANRFNLFEVRVRSQYFSANPLLSALEHSENAAQMRDSLTPLNCEYLLLHAPRITKVIETLPPAQKELWSLFVGNYLEHIHSTQGYVLYRLR